MAIRTSENDLRAVIETADAHDVFAFIEHANTMTDTVASNASDAGITLNANELKTIETYLAAHLYAIRYPKLQKRKVGRSTEEFQGKTGMGLEATFWGQTALSLDRSGMLAAATGTDGGNEVVGLDWVGTE